MGTITQLSGHFSPLKKPSQTLVAAGISRVIFESPKVSIYCGQKNERFLVIKFLFGAWCFFGINFDGIFRPKMQEPAESGDGNWTWIVARMA